MRFWFGLVAIIGCCAGVVRGQPLAEWIENADQPEDAAQWVDQLREHPLDLKLADAEAIAALPGFDPVLAARFVKLRERNAGIRDLHEFMLEFPLNGLQRIVLRDLCVVHERQRDAQSRLSVTTARGEQRADGVTRSDHARLRYDVRSRDGLRGFASVRLNNSRTTEHDVSAGLQFPARNLPVTVFAGDYQFNHGTGLLSGAAFGAGSWLRSSEISAPRSARGIVASPTASVMTRWRGGAIESANRIANVSVGGGMNSLDAATQADGSVVLVSSGAADDALGDARRAQLHESFEFMRAARLIRRTEISAAAVHSGFSPRLGKGEGSVEELALRGDRSSVGSVCVRSGFRELEGTVEVARSDPGRGAVQAAVVVRGEQLAMLLHTSRISSRFNSLHGQSWSGFAEAPGNSSATGVMIAFNRGRHSVQLHATSEITPFRTSTSPLRKTAGTLEARWSHWISGVVETHLLCARAWGEQASKTSAVVTSIRDRVRADVTWQSIPELSMRVELRRAAAMETHDPKLGTLVFAQARESRGAWQFSARVTAFEFESDDVSSAPYEQMLPGEYPLASLSGTGSRSAVVITRRLAGWRLGARAAYQASRLQGVERHGWEAALAMSVNR